MVEQGPGGWKAATVLCRCPSARAPPDAVGIRIPIENQIQGGDIPNVHHNRASQVTSNFCILYRYFAESSAAFAPTIEYGNPSSAAPTKTGPTRP